MERADCEASQPPLSRWGQAWRLLVCLLISAVAWVSVAEQQSGLQRWVDLQVGAAVYLLVFALRRRHPVLVGVLAGALAAVSGVAAGPAVLASVSVATRRRWREIALVGSVGFAGAQVYAAWQPGDDPSEWWLVLGANAVATSAMLAWGMYIGSRRELVWTLRQRAERAEAEQELRMAQARANERARIAREMHDVLAHRISQVSMHAGALAFREDLSPTEVHRSAEVIRDQAHAALVDLRGVLGVLRDADGEPTLAPQPTYADLAALVEEARGSGLRVDHHDTVTEPDQVPDTAGRTVYRIVQEGLTNARKHAPGVLLSIELSGSPDDGLSVEMRNPLGFGSQTPGAGLGLVGLHERAELRGGTLEARREGEQFVLRGWIPWTA